MRAACQHLTHCLMSHVVCIAVYHTCSVLTVQQFTRPLAAMRPLASTSSLPRASTAGIAPSLQQQQQQQQQQLPAKRSPAWDDSLHHQHPHSKHKRRPDVALLEHVSVAITLSTCCWNSMLEDSSMIDTHAHWPCSCTLTSCTQNWY
jgi:hypothetical protein